MRPYALLGCRIKGELRIIITPKSALKNLINMLEDVFGHMRFWGADLRTIKGSSSLRSRHSKT